MSFTDRPLGEFLEAVAAGSVTPGGGGGAAVGGATGAALGEMVCANTVGNEAYADVAGELSEVRADLAGRRRRLLELVDEDAAAVEAMMAAYGEGREEAIQESLRGATEVPLAIAEASLDVLEGVAVATELGNPNAVPDGFIGAHLARAALDASVYTVGINLPAVEDEAFVAEVEERSAELARVGEEAFERARENANRAV